MAKAIKIDNYNLLYLIGKGTFGEVYYTKEENSNIPYATKKIRRELADSQKYFKYFASEMMSLKNLCHKNIIKLKELKITKNHYYIIIEYCNGGTLKDNFEKYRNKFGKIFPEKIIQHFIRQIVEAVNYLHSQNIVHRDLKLENMLLNYNTKEAQNNLDTLHSELKLIDFGTAAYKYNASESNDMLKTVIGSPLNMDPIILKMYTGYSKDVLPYDEKIDIWSLGVISYYLFTGETPFKASNAFMLLDEIEKGIIKIPINLSVEAISFLLKMFQYYPEKRISTAELLKHPFIQKYSGDFSYFDPKNNKIAGFVKNGYFYIDIKNTDSFNAIINQYLYQNKSSESSNNSNNNSETDYTQSSIGISSGIGGSAPIGTIKQDYLSSQAEFYKKGRINSNKQVVQKPEIKEQKIFQKFQTNNNINNQSRNNFLNSSPINNVANNNSNINIQQGPNSMFQINQRNTKTQGNIPNIDGNNNNRAQDSIYSFVDQVSGSNVTGHFNYAQSLQVNALNSYQPNYGTEFQKNIIIRDSNNQIANSEFINSSAPIKGNNNFGNYQ